MTLGVSLVYWGTFIVHKWKKVPLEFTQSFAIGSQQYYMEINTTRVFLVICHWTPQKMNDNKSH